MGDQKDCLFYPIMLILDGKHTFNSLISLLSLNDHELISVGIASPEGEEVLFDNPVSTIDHPRINEWLTEMEKQMRLTLAKNLAKAVQDVKPFKDGAVECDKFLEWCDSYQVQIIVLSAQIRFDFNGPF